MRVAVLERQGCCVSDLDPSRGQHYALARKACMMIKAAGFTGQGCVCGVQSAREPVRPGRASAAWPQNLPLAPALILMNRVDPPLYGNSQSEHCYFI